MVKAGDTVAVHYKGTLTDGTLFDTSEGREPLQFEAGAGMMIKGFDDAVMDMKIGDKKTVQIPAAEAYGDYREDMLITVNRSEIPSNIPLQVGGMLTMHDGQNEIPVLITEVNDETVKLDANHALAGKDLVFDIELVAHQAGSDMEVEFDAVNPQ